MTRGFVLGKFMPPHAGHQLLVETARALVDELTVLVCWLPDDPIPGPLRFAWTRELFPDCRIVAHDAIVPQAPEEHPDFWAIWREIVRAAHPEPIDIVFASEAYGHHLAIEVGAAYRPIDPDRDGAPTSATAIRADPWAYWAYLPPPVRSHYARTVCLHGPESVGKSTLARELAAHFNTVFAPEYGRTWCADFGSERLSAADLRAIAETQDAMACSLRRRCNRRLILDTDPLMTAAWSRMLFGRPDPWFDGWRGEADLYLLLDTDLPWIDDGTRLFGGAARDRFLAISREELEHRGVAWASVRGEGPARLASALAAITAAGL